MDISKKSVEINRGSELHHDQNQNKRSPNRCYHPLITQLRLDHQDVLHLFLSSQEIISFKKVVGKRRKIFEEVLKVSMNTQLVLKNIHLNGFFKVPCDFWVGYVKQQ